MFQTKNYYHIEYLGEVGITQTCLLSLYNLLQTHSDLSYALLLTSDQTHALILKDQFESYYIIRSGFTSGYSGEGPKGLATALTILNKHEVETEEILISSKIMNKLNSSTLSDEDIDLIFKQRIIRPIRLHDYIYPFSNEVSTTFNLKRYYPLELPYSIIDDRIFDLALLFKNDPDSALIKAYKRLEDIVRTRTGLNEHSSKLFSQAFAAPNAPLTWDLPDKSEIIGRANLFIGAYQAFRNARTHREKPQENLVHQYREFLLINELYLLETEAKNI
ncbi:MULTISPECIES: TIGR02391 family protein [unclassified Acinetobacter]|uniref:TIGR02391 family protein n=1 Tax=unclassified Acinetobacter TaxID=196816 RepID=UPI0018AAE87B|nr:MULTISPECIES: TIGR02391 family protein [unclassified Acinetobacter]MBJ9954877.1 TIGR02391 family protein [Acinetobacter baumannii]